MYNITLISTRHQSIGKCNTNELYDIFERIGPEVIFEEIPPTFFDKYYVEMSRSNLESNAVTMYALNYNVKHIPVDSDNVPPEEFFKNYERMFKSVEGLSSVHGSTLRNLIDTNKMHSAQLGFGYLNSIESININETIYSAIKGGLEEINNKDLLEFFRLWVDTNDMRENHMLWTIYDYSKKNPYDRAIFTLGAAHRGSIIEKISRFQDNAKIKLNWII